MLVVLLLYFLVSAVPVLPQRTSDPSDCVEEDDARAPVYCGVKVFCKCAKRGVSYLDFETVEKCGLHLNVPDFLTPVEIKVKGKLYPLFLTHSSMPASLIKAELRKEEAISGLNESIYMPGGDVLVLKPELAKDMQLQPESLDTVGCGVLYNEDGLETTRLVEIEGSGAHFVPAEMVPILQIIHRRTGGECQYVHEPNPLPPRNCRNIIPKEEAEMDDGDRAFGFLVQIKKPRLRQTVVNTVQQVYDENWNSELRNSTPPRCFLVRDKYQIVCRL